MVQTMPSPHGHGKEGKAMAEAEELQSVYPASSFKAPHVYRDGRRDAVLVVDMLEDFIYGVLKTDRMVPKKSKTPMAASRPAASTCGIPKSRHIGIRCT